MQGTSWPSLHRWLRSVSSTPFERASASSVMGMKGALREVECQRGPPSAICRRIFHDAAYQLHISQILRPPSHSYTSRSTLSGSWVACPRRRSGPGARGAAAASPGRPCRSSRRWSVHRLRQTTAWAKRKKSWSPSSAGDGAAVGGADGCPVVASRPAVAVSDRSRDGIWALERPMDGLCVRQRSTCGNAPARRDGSATVDELGVGRRGRTMASKMGSDGANGGRMAGLPGRTGHLSAFQAGRTSVPLLPGTTMEHWDL